MISSRQAIEARFRTLVFKKSEREREEVTARVYIGLAEQELQSIDFEETSNHVDKQSWPSYKINQPQNQIDETRNSRFDAILKLAIDKWEMDFEWQREQRILAIDSTSIISSIPSSSNANANANSSSLHTNKFTDSASVTASPSVQSHSLPGQRNLHSEKERLDFSDSNMKETLGPTAALPNSVPLPTRLHQSFKAHSGPVNVVRYNSLGKYILTGGSDRQIRLWNARTGGETGRPDNGAIITYSQHSYEVLALDIVADNSKFASGGGDKSVFVWDVATGSTLRRFSGHQGKISDVRFGALQEGGGGDAGVLVTAGFDGTVRIYDLKAHGAWRPIMQIKDAKDAITCLFVNQESIFTASVDGCLRSYDLRFGQIRTDLIDQPITSLAVSKTGSTVLVSSLDSTHRLLDVKDGTLLQSFTGHQHSSLRCKACFTTSEDVVISGDETGSLLAWDIVSAKKVPIATTIESDSFQSKSPILWVEPNPDLSQSTELVSASADGVVNVWTS